MKKLIGNFIISLTVAGLIVWIVCAILTNAIVETIGGCILLAVALTGLTY